MTDEDKDARLRNAGADRWRAERPAWTQAGWWNTPLRPAVRDLLWLAKGPELMAAVQDLGPVDGSRCPFPHPQTVLLDDGQRPVGTPGNPCACQVILAAAWATAAAWAAEQADASALGCLGATAQEPDIDPADPQFGTITDPGIELLAPALRRSPASLRALIERLRKRSRWGGQVLADAVTDGLLPGWQGDLLLQDLSEVEPVGRDLVIDAVVTAIRRRHDRGLIAWTLSDLRRHARRVIAGLADELRRQRDRGKQFDSVDREVFADGRGRVIAELPADVVTRIHRRLTAIAHGLAADDPGDARSLDQIRADVFTDLLLTPDPLTPFAAASAASGEVAVVIDAATLLRGDHAPADVAGDLVPADVARELAADRRWRAWLTDATGTVVATSRTTYTPTAAVARVVRAREPHCRMPGCRNTRVDLDHVTPFPAGPTDPTNLASLCRRHHRLKTHRNWHLEDDNPAQYTWTDPNGITHTDHHDPPLPDTRPPDPG